MSTHRLAPDLPLDLTRGAQEAILEQRASGRLSPYACPDEAIIRREVDRDDEPTVLRPAFMRDTDKIVHMPQYNRLSGKTQVFSFHANDDLTRRGLHVQLVARTARDIGHALGLNLDLIEAIALGHDIGHTPFGHAGERYLNDIFHERTGRWFMHNVQSVRVLDVLGGRNLALQTLDGVICHNGEFEQQLLETSELARFEDFDAGVERCWREGYDAVKRLRPMTLEGCVVRVADIIAYVGKDRQDAIRAGIAREDTFADGLGGAYNSWALSAFITDVVEHSIGKPRIEMSAAAFEEMRRAKRENYEKIYLSDRVEGLYAAVGELFERMYEMILSDLRAGNEQAPVFRHHIRFVDEWLAHYGRSYDWQADLDLTVIDYIQSMTDDYFIAYAQEFFPETAARFVTRDHF